MKNVFAILAILASSASAWCQGTEYIHIFRKDNDFKTYKASDIFSIKFDKYARSQSMTITEKDGTTYKCSMSKIDSCVVRPYGLPEFHVDLIDYPDWTELEGAKDDIRRATIYMDGNGMYENLELQEVEFRGRGNSTWNMRKKPYRFKMAKKKSVCGLPKAKTFALIANNIDCTLMRNAIALWVAQYLEMPFSNHCIPVKVIFNGINKGQYMLTEKIGIGGGSVDIDETKGMLFELDTNYDEAYKFRYSWNNKYIPVMVKDPDIDELAEDPDVQEISDANAYFNLWKSDFTEMADAITQRSTSASLSDVIDLESAVNFFIVNSIANNHEIKHPKSLYLYKESLEEGQLYHFGPVWDFDWAFTFDGKEGAPANSPLIEKDGNAGGYSFFKLLFANKEFRNLYKKKLDEFIADGYPQLLDFIEKYARLIEPSAKENGLLWPTYVHQKNYYITGSFEFRENLNTLKNWLQTRIEYISSDANFGLYK